MTVALDSGLRRNDGKPLAMSNTDGTSNRAAALQEHRRGARTSLLVIKALLAAKYAGLSFDEFKSEMEQSAEFASFSAWRQAAEAAPR